MCGRATNVILAPSAGCKGFARRSVTSVPAPKRSKLWQIILVPGSSVSIGMLCRNFAYWLPKIGLLLGIFHAPRTENAPYGYERLGAPSENAPHGYARKKKKASTDGGQLFTKVALRSNVFHRAFFATGPPLRLRSRPPDSGFAGVLPRHCRHVIHAHLLGFWKLRNFLRPINASMKEATAKRHLLKDFNWKLMIFQSRRIVAALPNRPWLSRSMVF